MYPLLSTTEGSRGNERRSALKWGARRKKWRHRAVRWTFAWEENTQRSGKEKKSGNMREIYKSSDQSTRVKGVHDQMFD